MRRSLSHHLRVVRYDCRGHGASAVADGPYTLERLGHDLLALLDALQLERSHLCGLSLGGLVALWVALEHPERVGRAVFANTAARIGAARLWQERMDAVRTGGMQAIRDAVLARFLSERFRHSHPATTEQVGTMLEQTDPVGYMGACAALRHADLRGRLSDTRVPALIVAGELDEATPPAQAFELHRGIAGSSLVLLRDAAHLSNLERPEEFSNAVLSFLIRS